MRWTRFDGWKEALLRELDSEAPMSTALLMPLKQIMSSKRFKARASRELVYTASLSDAEREKDRAESTKLLLTTMNSVIRRLSKKRDVRKEEASALLMKQIRKEGKRLERGR